MRILDINDNEVQNPDLDLGYLKSDRIFVAHHDAVEAVKEEYHYETIREYPNGGKDVQKVVDVEAVEPKDAWDEYEDIQRYVLYTEEEYKARHENDNALTSEQRIATLEATVSELTNMIAIMMASAASSSDEPSASTTTEETPAETTETV